MNGYDAYLVLREAADLHEAYHDPSQLGKKINSTRRTDVAYNILQSADDRARSEYARGGLARMTNDRHGGAPNWARAKKAIAIGDRANDYANRQIFAKD